MSKFDIYSEPDLGDEEEDGLGRVYNPPVLLTYKNRAVQLAALGADAEEVFWGLRQDFGTRSSAWVQ